MWISRRRLAKDVSAWRTAGWVTPEGEVHIQQALLDRRTGPGLPAVLGILGVVLLGFAAMSFVAANWQDIPRLVRLLIIFAGLGGAYVTAAALFSQGMDAFAHAAVLLGVAVFGAGIMLIAQMYHIEGHPPDAVFVWGMGALGAGVLLRSNPALAAATLLFGLWSGWEMALSSSPHWQLLPVAGALGIAFAFNRWWPGLHLVAALLTYWLAWVAFIIQGVQGRWILVAAGLLVAVVSLSVIYLQRHREQSNELLIEGAGVTLGYGMIAAFAGLWAIQFLDRTGTDQLAVFGALTLALLVGAIHQGLHLGIKGAVWLGYAGFSAQIFTLYVRTVGSLLGSSVFFLVAGLIVIALSAVAWRLHRAEGSKAFGDPS